MSGTVYEEGDYLEPETLTRYLTRPPKVAKIMRNHWFRSLEFKNCYLGLTDIAKIWYTCKDIGLNLADTETEKYAQILLENPNPLSGSLADNNFS